MRLRKLCCIFNPTPLHSLAKLCFRPERPDPDIPTLNSIAPFSYMGSFSKIHWSVTGYFVELEGDIDMVDVNDAPDDNVLEDPTVSELRKSKDVVVLAF